MARPHGLRHRLSSDPLVKEKSLDLAREATLRWQNDAVLALGLCPFAHGPAKREAIHIQAAEARGATGAASEAVLAAHALLDNGDTDTTLVVFPFALDDFEDFLDVLDTCQTYVEERGLEDRLQIASFHPEYRFDGVASDDATNFTNRSPLPVLQWLRVEQVAEGIASFGETAAIPERNMARMRELNATQREALRALPRSEVQADVEREAWELERRGHYCASKVRITLGLGGISSTRELPENTVVLPGPWTLHVRRGEVIPPNSVAADNPAGE